MYVDKFAILYITCFKIGSSEDILIILVSKCSQLNTDYHENNIKCQVPKVLLDFSH